MRHAIKGGFAGLRYRATGHVRYSLVSRDNGQPVSSSTHSYTYRAHCSLLSAQCSLLTAQCSLLTAQCSLLGVSRGLVVFQMSSSLC